MSTVIATNLKNASSSGNNIVLNADGSVLLPTAQVSTLTVSSINGDAIIGTRNRLINGGMAVDQRNSGASQNFSSNGALAYSVDRWYGYSSGSAATGQRVQGATAGQYRYRFTGAAGNTAIGFGQRIEQVNCADLAGTTVTLSVDLANSLLTSVTWAAYYANTADTFGSIASPTKTLIATDIFTVSSNVTRYNTQISIPVAATTGIEILFTVSGQTSGTWTIGNVQLEAGAAVTTFERRNYGQELVSCMRYYEADKADFFSAGVAGYLCGFTRPFNIPKRVAPSMTANSVQSTTANVGTISAYSFNLTGTPAGTVGTMQAVYMSATYTASAEL